jgi:hypothetical protein
MRGSAISFRTATQDELEFLCHLTNLEEARIIERYYRGNRCQIVQKAGEPLGYAWLSDAEVKEKSKALWHPASNGDHCIYDVTIFRQAGDTQYSDILTCLAGQPIPRTCHCLNILLDAGDRKLNRAAERLFPKMREGTPGSQPASRPRKLREPAGQNQDA